MFEILEGFIQAVIFYAFLAGAAVVGLVWFLFWLFS